MAYKLIWSPSARLDLKDIAAFIAEDTPSAAQRFVNSVFRAVERLTDFPNSGRVVPELGDPDIREIIRRPISEPSFCESAAGTTEQGTPRRPRK